MDVKASDIPFCGRKFSYNRSSSSDSWNRTRGNPAGYSSAIEISFTQ